MTAAEDDIGRRRRSTGARSRLTRSSTAWRVGGEAAGARWAGRHAARAHLPNVLVLSEGNLAPVGRQNHFTNFGKRLRTELLSSVATTICFRLPVVSNRTALGRQLARVHLPNVLAPRKQTWNQRLTGRRSVGRRHMRTYRTPWRLGRELGGRWSRPDWRHSGTIAELPSPTPASPK